jgi:acyl-CoA synthetase (AMP-forming)/AMP-acid ligase II
LTGDLGTIEADGRIRFRGRLKEMIKTGGVNVAPLEVEQVLLQHPDIVVDVKAAIGSNLYYDAIKHEGACSRQTKAGIGPGSGEETGYCYIGATDNGLLVVLASYNGGGSGNFITLHILDVALAAIRESLRSAPGCAAPRLHSRWTMNSMNSSTSIVSACG